MDIFIMFEYSTLYIAKSELIYMEIKLIAIAIILNNIIR
jgi:hypothetical protein